MKMSNPKDELTNLKTIAGSVGSALNMNLQTPYECSWDLPDAQDETSPVTQCPSCQSGNLTLIKILIPEWDVDYALYQCDDCKIYIAVAKKEDK